MTDRPFNIVWFVLCIKIFLAKAVYKDLGSSYCWDLPTSQLGRLSCSFYQQHWVGQPPPSAPQPALNNIMSKLLSHMHAKST